MILTSYDRLDQLKETIFSVLSSRTSEQMIEMAKKWNTTERDLRINKSLCIAGIVGTILLIAIGSFFLDGAANIDIDEFEGYDGAVRTSHAINRAVLVTVHGDEFVAERDDENKTYTLTPVPDS